MKFRKTKLAYYIVFGKFDVKKVKTEGAVSENVVRVAVSPRS